MGIYERLFGDYTKNRISRNVSFVLMTKLRSVKQSFQYQISVEPKRTLSVDPTQITAHNRQIRIERGLGQIVDGGWDKRNYPLESHCTPMGLRQRFVEGRDWKDTVYYQRARDRVEQGKSLWGYNDVDHFLEERCGYVDELYQDMRDEGYRRTTTENHDVPETDHRNDVKKHEQSHEPFVVIGRDGEFSLRDGYHRVALASILEIAEIPVQVLARHSQWQSYREQAYQAESKSDLSQQVKNYSEHPDIEPFI